MANKEKRVMPPPYIGSLGSIYIPPERKLDNDLTKAVEKVLTSAIHDTMRRPNPRLDKIARQMGNLYNSGSDSTLVAGQIVKSEDLRNHPPEGYAPPQPGKNNFVVDNDILDRDKHAGKTHSVKATATPLAPATLRSADAVRLADSKPGGPFYVHPSKKFDPYHEKIYSTTNALSIVNPHSPRMWPEEVQYTQGSMPRTMREMPYYGTMKQQQQQRQQQEQQHQQQQQHYFNSLKSGGGCASSSGGADQASLLSSGTASSVSTLYSKTKSSKKPVRHPRNNSAATLDSHEVGKSRVRGKSQGKEEGSLMSPLGFSFASPAGKGADSQQTPLTGTNQKDFSVLDTNNSRLSAKYRSQNSTSKKVRESGGGLHSKTALQSPSPSMGGGSPTVGGGKSLQLPLPGGSPGSQQQTSTVTAASGVASGAGAGAGTGWYKNASTNLSVGSGGSFHSSSMTSLQGALLQDGYFKQGQQQLQQQAENSGEVYNGYDDDIPLLSVSELYENYRIRAASDQQKKSIAKHASFLVNPTTEQPAAAKAATRRTDRRAQSKGGVGDSALSLHMSAEDGLGMLRSQSTGGRKSTSKSGAGDALDSGRLSTMTSKSQAAQSARLGGGVSASFDSRDGGTARTARSKGDEGSVGEQSQDESVGATTTQDAAESEYEYGGPSPPPVVNSLGYLVGKKAKNDFEKIERPKRNHDAVKSYGDQMSKHLHIHTATGGPVGVNNGAENQSGSVNPYRITMHGMQKGVPHISHINTKVDSRVSNSTVYAKGNYVDNHFGSNFTILSSELMNRNKKQLYDKRKVQLSAMTLISPLDHSTKAPTRESVVGVLNDVAKKSIIAYDTRIVESGTAIKALVDIRHPTPGIAAIMQLHRAFIDAASLNPNPTTLTRAQVVHIIRTQLTWYPMESIHRLISSYDAQHSGMIKYARMSTTFLACCRPNMSILAGDKSKELRGLPNSYVGELMLLKLMHQLYEECEGGGLPGTGSGGMRIEDVLELLQCCATHIDDELAMERASRDMITLIYIDVQNENNDGTMPPLPRDVTDEMRKIAAVSIRHSLLKAVKGIARVSLKIFERCLCEQKDAIMEFSKQATKFRKLSEPYKQKGSTHFADDNGKFAGVYGTKGATYN